LATSVLLASVASALVGVREQAETRRLQARVWDAMRRRDHLEKQGRELAGRIDEALSPRRLLEARDRERAAEALAQTAEGR
jgi:hypothetical protein